MHPILFRIPLPNMPLKLWWALAAVAAIALVYAAWMGRQRARQAALVGFIVAVAAAAGGYALRTVEYQAESLPIYSYGVMLGLSLVVGWYLTLGLAERDGLPKEEMANCYVVTAIAAIVGARLLYILTNLEEFDAVGDAFALRRGGLVAYGGFLGGFLGSWFFLMRRGIRLMPWADVAVPSLASGLMITRIGCYLFGCDFGKRLSEDSPEFLKKLGTFPHWTGGTLEGGEGAPAYVRHLELFRGTPLGDELVRNDASFPVHPTQIYESLVGLSLLLFLLLSRKSQRFRGQIFFLFVFFYGFARFLLELLRDDTERGEYGPVLAEHVLIPGALLVFSLGFVFGISLGITNVRARTTARVASFAPPAIAYFLLKPQSFGNQLHVQLSTSQLIAVLSAGLVAYFFARFWQDARKNPVRAMSLGDFEPSITHDDDEADDELDDDELDDEGAVAARDDDDDAAPANRKARRAARSKARAGDKGKKKAKKKPARMEKKAVQDDDDSDDAAGDDDDSDAAAGDDDDAPAATSETRDADDAAADADDTETGDTADDEADDASDETPTSDDEDGDVDDDWGDSDDSDDDKKSEDDG